MENNQRTAKLLSDCNDVPVFEYQGVAFMGNSIEAAQRFVNDNPEPADFYAWLQDHYKQVELI